MMRMGLLVSCLCYWVKITPSCAPGKGWVPPRATGVAGSRQWTCAPSATFGTWAALLAFPGGVYCGAGNGSLRGAVPRCREECLDPQSLLFGPRSKVGRLRGHARRGAPGYRKGARYLPPVRRSHGNIRAASCKGTDRSANSTRSRSRTPASRPTPARR